MFEADEGEAEAEEGGPVAAEPSLNSSTETLPSDEAQARRQPQSCGAQESRFTEAVCSANSKTRAHCPFCSRQMRTLPSYEAEARMLPYLGWAW